MILDYESAKLAVNLDFNSIIIIEHNLFDFFKKKKWMHIMHMHTKRELR